MAQKHFNTAGPINRMNHYNIDPLHRIDLDEMQFLIDNQKYFVLHAPRQTGKTSYMLALMDYLNAQGKYICLYVNIESAQAARENVKEGIKAILNALAQDAFDYLGDSFFKEKWKQIYDTGGEFSALNETLNQWCRANEKPIILFIDEIDALVGDTLISVLRQLRSGYPKRPGMFPQSIILCGVRDVRDYRIHSDKDKTIITGGGRVEREYGLGRQRTDLLVFWPYKNGVQQVIIELKLIYGGLETTIKKGLEQTWEYMDKCGTTEGYLLVFNRAKKKSWHDRIFRRDKTFKGTKITVYGM